jgi:hypothetical protein
MTTHAAGWPGRHRNRDSPFLFARRFVRFFIQKWCESGENPAFCVKFHTKSPRGGGGTAVFV